MKNTVKKIVLSMILMISTNIYAQNSSDNVCNAIATFDTKTGELQVPCLIVDGASYYEVSLNQRTSSSFTLSLYNNLGDNLYLTPEIDPVWNAEKSLFTKVDDTLGWDKDVSDDFDGNYNSLSNKPTKLSDFDNDLTLNAIPQGYGLLVPRQNSGCPQGFTYRTVHFEVGNSNNANVGGCFKN